MAGAYTGSGVTGIVGKNPGDSGGGGGRPRGSGDTQVDDDDEGGRHTSRWRVSSACFAAAVALLIVALTDDGGPATINTSSSSVSVIVPALNEESIIANTVAMLCALNPPAAEVIVVDGGSEDSTVELARRAGARVLHGPRRRSKQMNLGADKASGDVLCFVHADSRPPGDLVAQARAALARPRVVLGGFRTVIDVGDDDGDKDDDGVGRSGGGGVGGRRRRPLRFMTWHLLVKTYYAALLLRPLSFLRGGRLLFGDQTLFCRMTDFRHVGGFDESLPIMEDADLCIKMHMAGPAAAANREDNCDGTRGGDVNSDGGRGKSGGGPPWQWRRRGRIVQVLRPTAATSGRRIEGMGNARASVAHFVIALAWYFGASPDQMYRLYHTMYGDAR